MIEPIIRTPYVHRTEKIMATKVCSHCGLEKDAEEFNWRYKVLGIRNPACKDCQHAFNKDYYEDDAKEWHLQDVKERTEAAREAARMMSTNIFCHTRVNIAGE
jgi:hypothetical protein